jgi:hypothetical protein
MVDLKGAKAMLVADGADVHVRNTISVAMEVLAEEGRKAVEQELEKEMVEIRRRKLVCFQKTRGGGIKKSDTAAASGAKVNSQLNPEDLAHMIDVSVAGKYGADLT